MAVSELTIPFVSPGEVLAAAIVLPIVGITVVTARFWQRSLQKAGVRADDYLSLLAW